MSQITGLIQSISAARDRIVIRGELGAGARSVSSLLVRESQPYETDAPPDWESRTESVPVAPAGPRQSFTLDLDRFKGGCDRLYSRFSVGVQPLGGAIELLPGIRYAGALGDISACDYSYPASKTIKGLQVNMVDDAIKLGVGHAALNLNLPTIMRPGPAGNAVTYRMDGREFYFDGDYLAKFDRRVKELSDHGIVVTLILLNSRRWDGVDIDPELRETLLHPDYDPEGFISAFNVVTAEGLAHYKAFVEFVAGRYTRPDAAHGRAPGFIVGNEVNSGWVWCNAGEKTVQAYVREYAVALRTAFYAARKAYAQARVYASLDHLWTIGHKDDPNRYYRGRDVIDLLHEQSRAEGDFDWSVAYHPYPQDLFHADFWHDETAVDSFDTPRITFRNIGVLSQYLSQPHLRYGGRLRHIILSEQGFHSDETEAGERLQAAAYAYAYWKVERTPGIESFILHAHVDHRDEFNLNLGLWRRDKASPSPNAPGSPKPIYEVFRDIDGPRREEILRWARGVVGEDSWI